MSALAFTTNQYESFNFEKDEVRTGVGEDSGKILEMVTTAIDNITEVSSGKLLALLDLQIIADEFEEEYWGVDGAEAISKETLEYALSFLQALPLSTKVPSVEADADDSIDFEWYVDKRHLFTVNIGKGGKYYFAGLFGEGDYQKAKGSGVFKGKITPLLAQLIEDVYK
ncbi:MAG: hypothetical protein GXP19_05985 [Gammaproteobacteria bacterium]|nr:hypothetical protein [Gammaproteobacteria bacterium]